MRIIGKTTDGVEIVLKTTELPDNEQFIFPYTVLLLDKIWELLPQYRSWLPKILGTLKKNNEFQGLILEKFPIDNARNLHWQDPIVEEFRKSLVSIGIRELDPDYIYPSLFQIGEGQIRLGDFNLLTQFKNSPQSKVEEDLKNRADQYYGIDLLTVYCDTLRESHDPLASPLEISYTPSLAHRE